MTARPPLLRAALHVVGYDLAVYRKTWRGSMLVSFISPLLFLAAMGIGLGNLVRRGSGSIGGDSYLQFIAPGLLASTAMQTAVIETTYPIMAKLHWRQIYDSMLATPLRVGDLLAGDALWLALRLSLVSAVFWVVMAGFGVIHSATAVLAVPAAIATGLAFGLPILAFTATQRRDSGFAALNRFVVLPLFLLSGPFFPVEQLPRAFQGVAWTAPLAHGVALCRAAVLGHGTTGGAVVGHIAVLVAYIVAGTVAAAVLLPRRLRP